MDITSEINWVLDIQSKSTELQEIVEQFVMTVRSSPFDITETKEEFDYILELVEELKSLLGDEN
jgi:hypothetical protein